MSIELALAHDRALAATRVIVAGIGDDQWALPTPCAEWNVRELVNHIVSGNFWAAELGTAKTIADVGDRLDGDVLGDDPVATYDTAAAAASAAFSAPGAMEAPCAVSYGPVPGEIYAGHRYIDVLIHGWDIAVATGQDTHIDPELVETCWEIVAPQADLLIGSGMFSTGVHAPPAADRETALLAVLGRTS